MGHRRGFTAAIFAALSCAAAIHAAPVTVNGAMFDAPASCAAAEGALVCKEDGQQLELWVYRKPLAPTVLPSDSLVRKMAYFNELHETAVINIMRSTSNDKWTPFSSYGSYAAVGSAMAGKGVVSSPTARFASVMHGDEVWQFLEVVATRTPAIDALTAALQSSLVLPALPDPVPSTAPVAAEPTPEAPKKSDSSPLASTFSGKLLSVELPGYLNAEVIEDTADSLQVNFKHKTRATAGPNLLISLRASKDKQTPTSIVKLRKATVTDAMVGKTESIELNKLGDINGAGFALIGTPNKGKGLPVAELLETTFAATVGDRVLKIRLTAEQQYSSEARVVWSSLVRSITINK